MCWPPLFVHEQDMKGLGQYSECRPESTVPSENTANTF